MSHCTLPFFSASKPLEELPWSPSKNHSAFMIFYVLLLNTPVTAGQGEWRWCWWGHTRLRCPIVDNSFAGGREWLELVASPCRSSSQRKRSTNFLWLWLSMQVTAGFTSWSPNTIQYPLWSPHVSTGTNQMLGAVQAPLPEASQGAPDWDRRATDSGTITAVLAPKWSHQQTHIYTHTLIHNMTYRYNTRYYVLYIYIHTVW